MFENNSNHYHDQVLTRALKSDDGSDSERHRLRVSRESWDQSQISKIPLAVSQPLPSAQSRVKWSCTTTHCGLNDKLTSSREFIKQVLAKQNTQNTFCAGDCAPDSRRCEGCKLALKFIFKFVCARARNASRGEVSRVGMSPFIRENLLQRSRGCVPTSFQDANFAGGLPLESSTCDVVC